VANRFPDLEVRDSTGSRGIRLEVKCIECVAEEPAANFDTLKKDLHPETDYVAVFVWEWCNELISGEVWERAPRILDYFIFHARSLGILRDYKWLNAPPRDIEGGVQAIDFRYAVTSSAGKYKKEGDNFGKILRIWSESISSPDPHDEMLIRTAKTQTKLASSARWRGFEFYARKILKEFADTDNTELRDAEGKLIGCTLLERSTIRRDPWGSASRSFFRQSIRLESPGRRTSVSTRSERPEAK
jgi:hypothetical protein